MKFDLIRPCVNCPFRSDIQPFLTKARAREIATSESASACHKTVDYSTDDDGRQTKNSQACAGAILLQEHSNRPNQMLRISERLGLYDRSKMDMLAPVFKSARAFIAAQPSGRARFPIGAFRAVAGEPGLAAPAPAEQSRAQS